jgi:hypothetical protein
MLTVEVQKPATAFLPTPQGASKASREARCLLVARPAEHGAGLQFHRPRAGGGIAQGRSNAMGKRPWGAHHDLTCPSPSSTRRLWQGCCTRWAPLNGKDAHGDPEVAEHNASPDPEERLF